MKILALDTATRACSVAVLDDAKVLAFEHTVMARGQAEALVPMVSRVMAQAGISFDTVARIAVTRGPGAFTGVRIGLATARALGLATGAPVVGVGTLEAMARAAGDAGVQGAVLSAIDSKRGDVFIQAFSAEGDVTVPPQARAPERVSDLLTTEPIALVGDASAMLMPVFGDRLSVIPEITTPDARTVGCLALNLAPDNAPPDPLYLRPADATPARNGGRLRP